jgi:hypothetical protein
LAATPRRPELLVVLLVGLASAVVAGWAARTGIDVTDEGYFLDLAYRVHQGQLPYRDFATYYTPGIFYLHAAAFAVGGVDLMPVRLLSVGLRTACGLALYGLTRRVAPWPFAAVAAALILSADAGPHPGWPALLAVLLMIDLLARHAQREHRGWLALAGLLAGVAFLFKQNVGAFAALSVACYVALRPSSSAGWLVVASQVLVAAGVALLVWAFLAPAPTVPLAATLWWPVVATLALLVFRARHGQRPRGWTAGIGAVLADGAAAGLGFGAVSLLWLVPLAVALGPGGVPVHLFLGEVNQRALDFSLEAPPLATPALARLALWLPLGLAWLCRGRPGWRAIGLACLASVLVACVPTRADPVDHLAPQPGLFPRLEELDAALGSLYVYLPALGAWVTVVALVLPTVPTAPRVVSYYLLCGVLAQLALHPRADTVHALLAGAPLFVTGAWALSQAHRTLGRSLGRLGRALLFAALLLVPVAGVLPHVYARYLRFAHPDPLAVGPATYVPLGLQRAPVLAAAQQANAVRGVVDFLRANTAPGEPLFAYPVDPLINFLVDRPNPTRFDHLMLGAMTLEDLDEAVRSLEAARPRYVLWDHAGVVFWHTDMPNRPLSDYIWRCYRQVATFDLFLILQRTEC